MFSSRRVAVAASLLIGSAALFGLHPTGARAAATASTRRARPLGRARHSSLKSSRAGRLPVRSTRASIAEPPTLEAAVRRANVPRSEFISVDEIKPGMTGYGLTVFRGTKIERFGVTVIDVLKRGYMGRDMILVRTSGPVFDQRKARQIHGMSGSPIYIDNRLAGAYSFGFDSGFDNEPVVQVTPIAYMLEAWDTKLPQKPLFTSIQGLPGSPSPTVASLFGYPNSGLDLPGSQGSFSAAGLTGPQSPLSGTGPTGLTAVDGALGAVPGQLTPEPLVFQASGLSPHVLQRLNQRLTGQGVQFQTVAGGHSVMADKQPPLQAGSAVGFEFATGDVELGGGGTVTYRRGNRIVIFGHPMLGAAGLGPLEMPMTTAYVADVLSNLMSSTKLQTNGSTIGSLVQDTPYSVAGVVGRMPGLVNVTVNVDNKVTGRHQTLHSRVMKHPLLTSSVIESVADEAIFRMHTFPGDVMAKVRTQIDAVGLKPIIHTNDYYAPTFVDVFALQDLDDLLTILTRNEFGPVDIKSVTMNVDIVAGRQSVRVERAFTDREKYEPGDTVQLGVVLRPWRKEPYVKTISFKVPDEAPDGRTQVVVSNGATPVNPGALGAAPGVPGGPPAAPPSGPMYRNVQQMIDRYLELGSNTDMVARLYLTSQGVNILGERLYDLPQPIADVLRSPRSSGYRPERDSIKQVIPMGEYVIGGAIAPITIQRNNYQEQGRTTARPAPQAPSGGGGTPSSSPPPPPPATASTVSDPGDDGETLPSPTIGLSGSGFRPAPWLDLRKSDDLLPALSTSAGAWAPEASGLADSPSDKPSDSPPAKPADKPAGRRGGRMKRVASPPTPTTKPGDKPADAAAADKKDEKKDSDDDKTKGPGRTATLWTLKTKTQFERGDGDGVGVTTMGDVRLAPTLHRAQMLEQEAQVWSMAPDGHGGHFLGTGNSGRIYHLDSDGKLGAPMETPELAIRTMTAAPDGTVYAAGWPTGTIYKLAADGKPAPFVKTDAHFILAMVTDKSGNLYASASPNGRILKIMPSGSMSVLFKSPEPHILSLAIDKAGNLIAGTSDSGALYRVTPDGRRTVLYDPEDNAVTALLVAKDGEIYAGTSPKGRVLHIVPNGTTKIVYEAGSPIMSLAQDADGNLYAGAGPNVVRIDRDEVVTGLDTKDQNQILNLAWEPGSGLWAASGNLAAVYHAESQKPSGEYLSPVHDTDNPTRWGRVSWLAETPKGASLSVETRTGNTEEPDDSWSGWSKDYSDPSGSVVVSPPARYIQYRARLAANDAAQSPVLKSVTISYLPENHPPTVSFSSPAVADTLSGKQTIRWSGSDPDKDTLTYDLYYSADGGTTWKPIKGGAGKMETKPTGATPTVTKPTTEDVKPPDGGKPTPQAQDVLSQLNGELDKDKSLSPEDRALLDAILPTVVQDAITTPPEKEMKPDPAPAGAAPEKPLTETSYSWDTSDVADGQYFLKVVASDKRSNPIDALTDDKVLGPITVVNSKPKVTLDDKLAAVKDRVVTVQGMADGLKQPITTVSYRVDKGDWAAAEAVDGLFDSPQEGYRIVTDPLSPGEHTIEVRATSLASLNATTTMKITVK